MSGSIAPRTKKNSKASKVKTRHDEFNWSYQNNIDTHDYTNQIIRQEQYLRNDMEHTSIKCLLRTVAEDLRLPTLIEQVINARYIRCNRQLTTSEDVAKT